VSGPADDILPTGALNAESKRLDLRLKELEIRNKEYEANHRPSAFRSGLANPAVIAAAIAAWASLTAAGLTWLSGTISARTQAESAARQADLERRRFEGDLILNSVKTGDPDHAATNLSFLLDTGLLTGDTAKGIRAYLADRKPGEGRALPAPR